jgi:hypothetical protein
MTRIRSFVSVSVLAGAASIASGILAGSAAAASHSCAYASVTPIFQQWQDSAMYTPFPGSTFENGASGWSWGNKANIVAGDSNPLLGSVGSHSVQIPGGGTARSPWLCVNSATPSMRFFVRRISGSGSLVINGIEHSDKKQLATVTTVTAGSSWQPSNVIMFPAAFTASDSGLQAQFQFTADPGTVFRIDDIELDPYLRR